jgi:amino acid transporter
MLRPWLLGYFAERVTLRQASIVAVAVLSALSIPAIAFFFGKVGEPYPSFGAYLTVVARAFPVAAVCGILLSSACTLALALIGLAMGGVRGRGPHDRTRRIRVVLLNHVALAIPLGCVLGALVLAMLGNPSFGLVTPKPSVLSWPVIEELGSARGTTMFIGLYVLNLGWALLRIGRTWRV